MGKTNAKKDDQVRMLRATPATGAPPSVAAIAASEQVQTALISNGCTLRHIAQLCAVLTTAVGGGKVADVDIEDATRRLRNAASDLEGACSNASRALDRLLAAYPELAPPQDAAGAGHH